MDVTHGGDVAGYMLRYGRTPIDFSASLNPLGMPDAIREAARKAIADSYAYPDPFCRELVNALAKRLSVPEEWLFCGNGAADIIFRLVQAMRPRRALVTAPAFSEYEQALESIDCRTERHLLTRENRFTLDDGIIPKIVRGLDLLFLCQPNNPTGQLADPELMTAILKRCARTGTLLFVDECFCRFVDEPEKHSLLRHLGEYPNLFILDSFTKLYGMAGIRLGHGVSSDTALIKKVSAAGQPWAVSTVAQAAGLAALGEDAFVERSLSRIRQAKRGLVDGLGAYDLEVFGAEANYVFFRSPVTDLDVRLAGEGLMIRNCGNFHGLEPGYYRVAVRLEEDNRALIEAMGKIL